jgi:hypothetical protein
MAMPLMIIVPDSGPTDRDCNRQGFKSSACKKIAHHMAFQGIATSRYDKRGVGESVKEQMKEEDLRSDDMVNDLKAIITQLKGDKRFSQVIAAVHSEGSLVGMMAVGAKHRFISIAGVALPAHQVLKEQLKGQLGEMENSTFKN